MSYTDLTPDLTPELARIYYHELNVFNNPGDTQKGAIQATIVVDNLDETNRTNSLNFINNSSEDRGDFINHINYILTTSTPERIDLRKLDNTDGDAKPYRVLITENEANQIIKEVKNLNMRAEQFAKATSSTDDTNNGDPNTDARPSKRMRFAGGSRRKIKRRRVKSTRGRHRRHNKSTRRRRASKH